MKKIANLQYLKYKGVRQLFITYLLGGYNQSIQHVVIGWFTYNLTNSPILTSLTHGVATIPNIITGPIGGYLADKFDRKNILIFSNIGALIITAIFSYLISKSFFQVSWIFIFLFLKGVIYNLSGSSGRAILANVIPKNQKILTEATAITIAAYFIATTLIPPFAGKLFQLTGPSFTLGTISISLFFAILIFSQVKMISPEEKAKSPANFKEIFYFITEKPILQLMLFSKSTIWMIITPFTHGILPIFAKDILNTDAVGLGILFTSLGLGGLTGSLIVIFLSKFHTTKAIIIIFLFLSFIAMLLLSISNSMFSTITCLFLINVTVMGNLTYIQSNILFQSKDEFRGRISSIDSLNMAMAPIGNFSVGFLIKFYNISRAIQIGSFTGIIITILSIFLFPNLMDIKDKKQ